MKFHLFLKRKPAPSPSIPAQPTQVAITNPAIRLDPNLAEAFFYRGKCRDKKDEREKAFEDYTEAIRLDPIPAGAYNLGGICRKDSGEFGKPLVDFPEVARLDPNDAAIWYSIARIYASCPNKKIRVGIKAVSNAKQACKLTNWQSANGIDALAAAFAKSGDFAEAIRRQNKAVELRQSVGNDTADFQERLELYEQGKPNRKTNK